MRVLVLNCGSSSIKYVLVDVATGEKALHGVLEEVADHQAALRDLVDAVADEQVDAVGHRVVHGGEEFTEPTLIDDHVIDVLESLVPLAPLHNPANISGIRAARAVWPDVAQVAVFDTAFHRTLPAAAFRYAVPTSWYTEHSVRRYGFHGTSHAYVARRAAGVLGRPLDELDLITAHLGNGASIAAIAGGRSVDTSMGLSPLEGLVMGTRSGDIDPAVVAHVAQAQARDPLDVIDDLTRRSGLRGLCGDSDMRTITERADAGDDDAALAMDVFAHRVKKYLGAYLAVLGGCDAIVFTGGIGEHNARIRAAACSDLKRLGIDLDRGRNEAAETIVSTDDSPTAILVIPTDEEHEIADQTAAVVG
jgi:acetate kinase